MANFSILINAVHCILYARFCESPLFRGLLEINLNVENLWTINCKDLFCAFRPIEREAYFNRSHQFDRKGAKFGNYLFH
jgi:hypothetical protein